MILILFILVLILLLLILFHIYHSYIILIVLFKKINLSQINRIRFNTINVVRKDKDRKSRGPTASRSRSCSDLDKTQLVEDGSPEKEEMQCEANYHQQQEGTAARYEIDLYGPHIRSSQQGS